MRAGGAVGGAGVGAVVGVGGDERDFAIERELLADVGGPAAKAVGSAGSGEVLDVGEVVEAEGVVEEAGLDLDADSGLTKLAERVKPGAVASV